MVEMSGAGVCFRLRTAGHREFKLLSPFKTKEMKKVRDICLLSFFIVFQNESLVRHV